MAAAVSPPLLLAVLLLTTAGTTQCHGHKRHHHQTDGTRRPSKAAAEESRPPAATAHHTICQKTPHSASCLAAVASHLDAVAGASGKAAEASAVSVQLLPPDVLSVVLASLRGAASALSSLSPAISTLSVRAAFPTGAPLRRGAAQDCQELHAASLSSLSRAASLLAAPGDGGGLPAARAHLAAALANKATCLDGLAGASSGPGVAGLLASFDDAYEHVSNSLALVARGGVPSAAGFANAVAKAIHNRRLLQDDDNGDGEDDSGNNGDGDSGNADQRTAKVITVAQDGTGDFRTVGEAVAAAPNNSRDVVLTAQGRGDPNEDTGIAVLNCTVDAAAAPLPAGTRTFLGRPWGAYARAAVMDSYLGPIVDREGWAEWPGAEPGRGDTVFFGEYGNGGPGAGTEGRVRWAGVRQMDYDEAAQFAVENFIYGNEWLGATSFPYDDDV
ncbi:hypothetical protein PVAP13_4KG095500 [Panicum virgatum]|uniref:Pectinesterase inhibitor domain-containing protein n=1 Tax=Panicum virgatum TaxID=38727 RepID=A0A8T0TQA6_PANVG|nr:hypothetical protein PVAP13_4KG095500 [Panicum virgatum]